MLPIEPLPAGAWSVSGQGVLGSHAGTVYRATATEPTRGRPGLRWSVLYDFEQGREYALDLTVRRSDGTMGGKRLTFYWIMSEYGTLPYGDGPYGGALLAEQRAPLGGPAVGGQSVYTFRGLAPEGAIGIAVEFADHRTTTPWAAGGWIEAEVALSQGYIVTVAHATMEPVPRVRIVLHSADTLGAETVTAYAMDGVRERPVRGAWRVPATSLVTVDDYSARFGEATRYRIELRDAGGALLETIEQTAPLLDFQGTVVQHILDPYRSTGARLIVGSEDELTWKHDGSMVRPGAARYPTWIGSGRWPLQGIPLVLGTDTAEQEAAMRRVFALDGDEDDLPMIVLRTSHRVRFPQPLQAVVPEVAPQGLDWVAGGFTTHWRLTASEALPPAISIIRAGVTWEDVAAVYPSWNALASAYPTWAALMQDESLAGASNA